MILETSCTREEFLWLRAERSWGTLALATRFDLCTHLFSYYYSLCRSKLAISTISESLFLYSIWLSSPYFEGTLDFIDRFYRASICYLPSLTETLSFSITFGAYFLCPRCASSSIALGTGLPQPSISLSPSTLSLDVWRLSFCAALLATLSIQAIKD